MSSAQKGEAEFSSCLHVRKFRFGFLHRAKPVNEGSRRFSESALRGKEEELLFQVCTVG